MSSFIKRSLLLSQLMKTALFAILAIESFEETEPYYNHNQLPFKWRLCLGMQDDSVTPDITIRSDSDDTGRRKIVGFYPMKEK